MNVKKRRAERVRIEREKQLQIKKKEISAK